MHVATTRGPPCHDCTGSGRVQMQMVNDPRMRLGCEQSGGEVHCTYREQINPSFDSYSSVDVVVRTFYKWQPFYLDVFFKKGDM